MNKIVSVTTASAISVAAPSIAGAAIATPQIIEADIDAELVAMGKQFAELAARHAVATELEKPHREEIDRAFDRLNKVHAPNRIPRDASRAAVLAAIKKCPLPVPSVDDIDRLIIPLGEKMNTMKARTLEGFQAKALLVQFWPTIDLNAVSDEWWPEQVLRDLLCDLIGYDEPGVSAVTVSDETTELAIEYELLVRSYIDARVRWAGARKGSPAYTAFDDEMCEISSKMDPLEDRISEMSATSITALRAVALKELRYSMPTDCDSTKLSDGFGGDLNLLRASLRFVGLHDLIDRTEERIASAIDRRRAA